MANRLATASSPYLRQHAENPVDWHEWGEEAFEKARSEDRPVFLSVGYASCHWCHVMAHESFEDREVAEVLNRDFVPVKVDREERPDVDAVYMAAVQALTGHGGWPMSVFLTPDGQPFFGGTYWPKEGRMGMPGFLRVLEAVRNAWAQERDKVHESGQQLAAHLQAVQQVEATGEQFDRAFADGAAARTVQTWDPVHGGFGAAPKFPQAMTIDFLLAHHLRSGDDAARRAAVHSLEQMARGGIYDHVGGGFARYSVDERWLVPHFEKMLYDNALLLRAYTHAWQTEGQPRFARVARETADYLIAEMQHAEGGFFSSTDADSEGEEGRFFTWPYEEFREVVADAGEDPDAWGAFFGVTQGGNFEGRNILHEAEARPDEDPEFAARLGRVRAALYTRRSTRVPPALDDKVLTSWNALVIGALAEAGAVLGEPRYVEAARAAAGFLRDQLVDRSDPARPQLRHTWSEGHGASVPALLEDVAFLAQGLLTLYEADADPEWFSWAQALAEDADARFAEEGPDGPTGAYFSTPHDGPALVTRPKDLWDNATPSGASVMADVHLRLAALTGLPGHDEQAERILSLFAPRAAQAPTGLGEMLRALERAVGERREIAVVGDPAAAATQALIGVYRERWRPAAVLAVGPPDGDAVPLLAGRELVDGRPAAYVCQGFACLLPTSDPEALRAQLADV